MSTHTATIRWMRKTCDVFHDNHYSREHTWAFDGGITVPASPSPYVIPAPYSVEANVDPEEAFIAALSSCHMLVFLSIAAKRGYIIDSYTDHAVGVLEENDDGYASITKVTLRPHIVFSSSQSPTLLQLEKMHHLAHKNCFIANSVKTKVVTEVK